MVTWVMNSADFHDYHHRLLYTKSGNYSSTFTYMDWYALCLLTLTYFRVPALALFATPFDCLLFMVKLELCTIAGKTLESFCEAFVCGLMLLGHLWRIVLLCSGYLALTRGTGS